MEPPPSTSLVASRLRLLDALRGLAALYVVISHARYLLHEGLSTGYNLHPDVYVLWQKIAIYGLGFFGWGHEAVILFFVLSGFAIHLRQAREHVALGQTANLNLLQYLWRRGKRLYPPLLLALGLTWGLDMLGASLLWATHPSIGAVQHDGRTLLGNFVFAMDNWGQTPFQTFGTNKPLWSLRYEAAFYLLYPLLWLLNRKSVWLTAGISLFVALTFALLPSTHVIPGLLRNPLELLLVWWMGGFLADVYTGRINLSLPWLTPLILLLPLSLRIPSQEEALIPHPYATWTLGLSFLGLMTSIIHWHHTLDKWPCVKWLEKLGDCSYTLYVIHMPILVLAGGWLMSCSPEGKLPVSPIWVLPGVALCIILAWLAHFVVEKPFTGSRKKKGMQS